MANPRKPTDPSLGLFRDERGSKSLARHALVFVLLLIAGLAIYEAYDPTHAVNNTVWATLSAIAMGLIAWAGGPRIAQYLAPQIGAVASGASTALRRAITRDPETGDEASPAK